MTKVWLQSHVPKPVLIHLQCSRSVQACMHAVHKLSTGLGIGLGTCHVYISKQLPSLGTPTSTAVVVPDPGVHDCNKASY